MHKRLEILKIQYARFWRVLWPRRVRRLKIMSRHPFAVPVFTFAALIALTIFSLVLIRHVATPTTNAYMVIISDNGIQQTVPSREPTVGDLIAKLHITLN